MKEGPFEAPNFTQVPNIFLENLHDLSLAEIKVMLLVLRNTVGWKGNPAYIASQNDISSATGLSRSSVQTGVDSLLEKKWIVRSESGGRFSYRPNIKQIKIDQNSVNEPDQNSIKENSACPKFGQVSDQNSVNEPDQNSVCLIKESTLKERNKEDLLLFGCDTPEERDTPEAVVDEWNKAQGVREIRNLNGERRKKMVVRLKEVFWKANWRAAIAKVAASSFCTGQNERSWQADIDWFLRPGTMEKIIEGQYDDKKGKKVSPDYDSWHQPA